MLIPTNKRKSCKKKLDAKQDTFSNNLDAKQGFWANYLDVKQGILSNNLDAQQGFLFKWFGKLEPEFHFFLKQDNEIQ